MTSPTEWYRDNFFISTKPSLIQPQAVNKAYASKSLYWTREFKDMTLLKTMLDSSLCFGLYEMPVSSSEIAGRGSPQQIGLARVVTDKVTIAYLTDVYVVEEHQGKGLGKWLIACVNEHIQTWPELRRVMLITSGTKFYEGTLEMEEFKQGTDGIFVMSKRGPGSVMST